jgi:hypothetical protein
VIVVGMVLTAGVALALAVLPTRWLTSLLDVDGPAATAFLVRRYAVSATAALCVALAGIVCNSSPERTALRALATWFGVKGVVAWLGLLTGDVGGLAWVAAAVDPLLAAGFLIASRGAGLRSSGALAGGGGYPPTSG